MEKYDYEVVRIRLRHGFMEMRPEEDYREVIRRYAEMGWRFKQVFAPPVAGYGHSAYFDVIFEREV